jgi:hypothetical protein
MWTLLLSNWKTVLVGICIFIFVGLFTTLYIDHLRIVNLTLQLKQANDVIATYKVDVAKQNTAIDQWKSKATQLQKQMDQSKTDINGMRSDYEKQIADLKNSKIGSNTETSTDPNCKIVRQDSHSEVQKLWDSAVGR